MTDYIVSFFIFCIMQGDGSALQNQILLGTSIPTKLLVRILLNAQDALFFMFQWGIFVWVCVCVCQAYLEIMNLSVKHICSLLSAINREKYVIDLPYCWAATFKYFICVKHHTLIAYSILKYPELTWA